MVVATTRRNVIAAKPESANIPTSRHKMACAVEPSAPDTQVLAFCRHDWAPSAPAPQPLPDWEDEPWEVRRDAYGSRVLVPRSQCADDAEEDDFDDDDAAYDDADEDYDAYYAVNTPSNESSSDDDDDDRDTPPRQEVA